MPNRNDLSPIDPLKDVTGIEELTQLLSDPHIARAIGVRLYVLSLEVAKLREKEEELIDKIDAIASKQLDEEQLRVLKIILKDEAGQEWFRARLKVYGIGGIALLASIYAAREYLGAFFSALGRFIKG